MYKSTLPPKVLRVILHQVTNFLSLTIELKTLTRSWTLTLDARILSREEKPQNTITMRSLLGIFFAFTTLLPFVSADRYETDSLAKITEGYSGFGWRKRKWYITVYSHRNYDMNNIITKEVKGEGDHAQICYEITINFTDGKVPKQYMQTEQHHQGKTLPCVPKGFERHGGWKAEEGMNRTMRLTFLEKSYKQKVENKKGKNEEEMKNHTPLDKLKHERRWSG